MKVSRVIIPVVLVVVALLVTITACSEADPGQTSTPEGSAPTAAAIAVRMDIEGGIIRLAGQREGLIEAVFVEEGDRVHKGQVIARIDPDLLSFILGSPPPSWRKPARRSAGQRGGGCAARTVAAPALQAQRAIGERRIDEGEVEVKARTAAFRAAKAAVDTAARRLEEARFEVEVRQIARR